MTAPFNDDDTAIDQPEPTKTFGLVDAMDVLTHGSPERAQAARANAHALANAQHADAIDQLRHQRTIRDIAEREAKARAGQQRAIECLVWAMAIGVPILVVLAVYGLWTGSLFG